MSPFDCESCQLGKHHRITFRRLRLVSSQSLFDLVHCNVWGSSCVQLVLSNRYYIVFVDDYSHTSWVYLLKDRLHVMPVVRQFLVEMKNQFSTIPKCLHTDNALEFVQNDFQSLCASLGIIHQTTYPHTSQQNGVAEWKHRHIWMLSVPLCCKWMCRNTCGLMQFSLCPTLRRWDTYPTTPSWFWVILLTTSGIWMYCFCPRSLSCTW